MLPTGASAGRGLSFSLFGFPVRVDVSFVLVAFILGLSARRWEEMAIWVVLVIVSVLIHELGHAFAGRALGAEPTIELAGLGGLTRVQPPSPPTRLQTIGLALAGPGAGLVIGAIVVGGVWAFGRPAGDLADFTVVIAAYINIGWSLFNLLPVLPLDGGAVLTELLPGDRQQRVQRASWVSVATGVVGAIALYRVGFVFGAILFAVLAGTNFATARRLGSGRAGDAGHETLGASYQRLYEAEPDELEADAIAAVAAAAGDKTLDPAVRAQLATALADADLRSGDPDAAEERLRGLPVDPTIRYVVAVHRDGDPADVAALIESYRRTSHPLRARHLVLGLVRVGRADEVPALLDDDVAGLGHAQLAAHREGAYELAAAIGALVYERHADTGPLPAVNVACSMTRLGEMDRAMGWLRAAVDRGLDDVSILDADPDLAPLRPRADFAELRSRVGGTSAPDRRG